MKKHTCSLRVSAALVLALSLLSAWMVRHTADTPPSALEAAGKPSVPPRYPAALTTVAEPPSREAAAPEEDLPPPLEAPAFRPQKMADLPPTEQASLQQAIFTAMYAVEPLTEAEAALPENEGVSHFATDGGQKFQARFLKDGGVRLGSSLPGKTWQGTLRVVAGGGRGAAGAGGGADRPYTPYMSYGAYTAHLPWQATSTRAEREAAPGLTEWYENRAEGLEHGFTLAARPAGAGESGFTLDVALEGLRVEMPVVLGCLRLAALRSGSSQRVSATDSQSLSGRLEGDTTADADRRATAPGDLVFTDPETDTPVLAYRSLKVWDTTGRELAAAMRPTATGLRFSIRDEDAVYPVTIDPLVASLETKLDGGAAIGAPRSVAIDGDVLAIGTDLPTVLVFRRQVGQWTLADRLTPPSGIYSGLFGASVAMGNGMICVGDPGTSRSPAAGGASVANAGAVHLYSSSHLSWLGTLSFDEPGGRVAPRKFGSLVALDRGTGHVLVSAPAEGSVPGDGPPVQFVPSLFRYQDIQGSPSEVIQTSEAPTGIAIDQGVLVIAYSFGAEVYNQPGLNEASDFLIPTPGTDDTTRAVDISGDTIVMGSRNAAANGKVFIYRRNGNAWPLLQTLDAPAGHKQFGASVAIEGSTLIVAGRTGGSWLYTRGQNGQWSGASLLPVDSENAGAPSLVALSPDRAVMLLTEREPALRSFDQTQGTWTAGPPVVLGISRRPSDHFGLHVALDGDVAVVGALDHSVAGASRAGKAWVFRRGGGQWKLETSLINDPPAANDRFGVAVGVSGNRIAVGADYDDEGGLTDCGGVSVYEYASNTWMRRYAFNGLSGGSQLGRSVAISGDYVAAGAVGVNSGAGQVLAWWLYKPYPDDWDSLRATITPLSGLVQTGANFGFSVALSGGRLLVGAPGYDTATATNAGRFQFYNLSVSRNAEGDYVLDAATAGTRTGTVANGGLGFSVAMDGNLAVVGGTSPAGWFTNSGNSAVGSAYVFEHNGSSWNVSGGVELSKSGVVANHYFGSSVAVSGNVIAVGAFGNAARTGGARIYQKQGTQWVQALPDMNAPAGDSGATDTYGISTALSGDTLLVGAYGVNAEAGAVYVYRVTDPNASPPLNIAPAPVSRDLLQLTWPTATGLVLWQSPTGQAGSWTKVTGSENQTSHTISTTSAPSMFFRLGPP